MSKESVVEEHFQDLKSGIVLESMPSVCHFALCLPLGFVAQCSRLRYTLLGNIYEWPNTNIDATRMSNVEHNFTNSAEFCYMTTILCWGKIVKAAVLLLSEMDLWHSIFQGNAWGWNFLFPVVCQKPETSVFQRFKSGMYELKMGSWWPRGPHQRAKQSGIWKNTIMRAIK